MNVVDHLRKTCGLADRYTDEDIHRILGVIRTNGIHVQHEHLRNQDVAARAVYPTLSIVSHSCVCNAKHRYVQEKN